VEYIAGIEKAFKDYIGSDSINKLREKITDKPMILIAGDQLTGKSTQAKNLAEYYRGTFYSVGNLFREVAAKKGITVAEQAKLLLTERGIDVEIDYKTCEMISGNSIDTNLGVIEGRQPAYMGSFMQELGKRNLVRIYFQCSIREQALRFLRREIGELAYQKGLANVPDIDYRTLKSLQDEIYNLELQDSNEVIQKFVDNQSRDEDDRERYSSLYGFDYGNLNGYDIVINTTNKEADFVFKEVVSELENFGFRTN
jgi:cytidylate kinase|tara:strand:+ start:446 stop:1210 length:765 start_codon:yes stop_codon:yes gene_type:complete